MDGLTGGFNISANVSQDEDFNALLGFTAEETLANSRWFVLHLRRQSSQPKNSNRSGSSSMSSLPKPNHLPHRESSILMPSAMA